MSGVYCIVFNLLHWLYRKYSKTPHISISLISSCRLWNWPRSDMYLYDAEPNFSLRVLNPRFPICGINCGHKWSISTEKVRTSSIYFSYYLWKNITYIFSSYLTDTFAFKWNLSILICVFPAYNYWIPFILKMPRFFKCRRLQICRFHSFTLLKATKHKYLNNTKSEFKLFEVLVQPKKLQRLKQSRNCRN